MPSDSTLVPFPDTVEVGPFDTSDGAVIVLKTAAVGKRNFLIGLVYSGGTTVAIKSAATTLGSITTTGVALPVIQTHFHNQLARAYFQTEVNEALNLDPDAVAIKGWAYVFQA